MDNALADRLADVDRRIAEAARDAHRDPAEITRIVVTKFHPVELIRDLHDLGVRDFGENRQQELSAKRAEIGELDGATWHFIGQAQTNKARAVRADADVVHSVDRARIADALDAAAGGIPLPVLLQINLTRDAARGGVAPDGVAELAAHVEALPGLRLRGVMAVAPLDENPAAAFARLRASADDVRGVAPDATWISAGMTGDFPQAVAIGATHLRIGSAITGPRPSRD